MAAKVILLTPEVAVVVVVVVVEVGAVEKKTKLSFDSVNIQLRQAASDC